MIDIVLTLGFLGFWVWALLDIVATDAKQVRNLPKVMWFILVLIVPFFGALVWLFLGRPDRATRKAKPISDYAAPRRPLGIEDDASFNTGPTPMISDRRSAELDEQLARWEEEQRRQKGD